jgi:hypothetical protein
MVYYFVGKFHPKTCHESTEGGYSYSYTLSLTSAPIIWFLGG